jgi:hypothetical protein
MHQPIGMGKVFELCLVCSAIAVVDVFERNVGRFYGEVSQCAKKGLAAAVTSVE